MTHQAYEYIRLSFDYDDLSEMNRLSSIGWRVVAVTGPYTSLYALLERPMFEEEK